MTKDEKRAKFKNLATKRTNIILKRLKVLGNCANRSTYAYNEDEIKKIFSTIENKLREVKAKFHFPKDKEFKL